jgi:hypothetical protein
MYAFAWDLIGFAQTNRSFEIFFMLSRFENRYFSAGLLFGDPLFVLARFLVHFGSLWASFCDNCGDFGPQPFPLERFLSHLGPERNLAVGNLENEMTSHMEPKF